MCITAFSALGIFLLLLQTRVFLAAAGALSLVAGAVGFYRLHPRLGPRSRSAARRFSARPDSRREQEPFEPPRCADLTAATVVISPQMGRLP